jgi:hypothetical protein
MKTSSRLTSLLALGLLFAARQSCWPAQPAILTASGASKRVVVFPDPGNAPATQTLVPGLPAGANPQGVAYYGSDNGLIADAGNSRIFVVQVSTGALLATIDTTAAGFPGSGTIAVSPDQTTALAMSNSSTLHVVHGPFNASSSITSVTLPGTIGTYQTQAIVFNAAGRAFVYTTAGVSVLDPPYTSVAFTMSVLNTSSGAVAISPNGNTILFTDLGTTSVGIIQAPFSAGSPLTGLAIPGGNSLDGIAIAPDGASAIVVSNGAHHAAGIAAPFTSSSTVSNIPLPAGVDAFEDVGISADSQLAILAGGSIAEPAIFVHAPFNSASVTSNVPISAEANTSRGRGGVRFRPPGTLGTLGNISTRLQVGTADRVMIAGFIVQGNSPKKVLIRAAGPSLTQFGVPDALANPRLELHDTNNTIGTNDDWQTTQIGGVITSDQVAEIQNSGLAPRDPLECALIATLAPGSYTAIVQGVNSGTGVGIVEAYDLDATSGSVLANIATRGFVQTGDNAMIGGFIVVTQPTRVIIRAIGPSLSQFGVPNALANPQLELHDTTSTIARNDDWQTTQIGGIITSDQVAAIQNSQLAPTNTAESAIIATLQPGNYTAIVRGVNSTAGNALVEVYSVP